MGFTTDRFALTTIVWDDTQQPAIQLRDVGAHIPTIEQINGTSWWAPNFDAIGDQLAYTVQFPHKLSEQATVTVTPHVHWMSSSDSANVVRWQLSYQWLNTGEVLGADTTITVDGTPSAYEAQKNYFAAQSKAGALISSIFAGTLTRITNGATDYTGEVYLLFLDLHFQIDTLGSDSPGTKSFPS